MDLKYLEMLMMTKRNFTKELLYTYYEDMEMMLRVLTIVL